MVFKLFRLQWLFVFAAAVIVSAAGYGFAASVTIPATSAGEGSGAVGRFTPSNVQYTLDSTTPSNIYSVTFTISPAMPAGGTVKVRLGSASSNWYDCTVTGGTSVLCTTTSPPAPAQTTDILDIVAAQ